MIRLLVSSGALAFAATVSMAQCTLPRQVYLPIADRATCDEYGDRLATFDDYVVTSGQFNDSLTINAGWPTCIIWKPPHTSG